MFVAVSSLVGLGQKLFCVATTCTDHLSWMVRVMEASSKGKLRRLRRKVVDHESIVIRIPMQVEKIMEQVAYSHMIELRVLNLFLNLQSNNAHSMASLEAACCTNKIKSSNRNPDHALLFGNFGLYLLSLCQTGTQITPYAQSEA
jgi:hypothetical protein